jgi:hypothetical protein
MNVVDSVEIRVHPLNLTRCFAMRASGVPR